MTAGFVILSYYAVVAGWAVDYLWLALKGTFSGQHAAAVPELFGALLADPAGIVATVMTFIPFTAPLTVLMRAAVDPAGLPWWQILLSFAVMVASTFVALKIGARLFRVGLLLTGTRPSLRQIVRQAGLVPGRNGAR